MSAEVREQESPEDRGVLGALLAPVSMLCSFDPPPRRSSAPFHQLSADVFNGVHLRDSCCVSVSSPGPGYVWFPRHTGTPSSWVRLLLVWRRVLARVSQFSFSPLSVPICLSRWLSHCFTPGTLQQHDTSLWPPEACTAMAHCLFSRSPCPVLPDNLLLLLQGPG